MSTNWELETGEIVGTEFCGPNRTPAFQWNMSPSILEYQFRPDLNVVSENGETMRLDELLTKMKKKPIQSNCY